MDEQPYPESPILVVDDEQHFITSVEVALKIEGITNVKGCQKSSEVLPRLRKKKYSLILLDLIMPEIRGEELLKLIKEEYPEIPIIIITADKDIEKAVECLNQGESVIDYLVKPVNTDHLLEKVRSGLDLKGRAKSIIDRISPEIKDKKIDRGNVGLFYTLGQAYERIEEFEKAVDLYLDIARFDPDYKEIQEKINKFKNFLPKKHDQLDLVDKSNKEVKLKLESYIRDALDEKLSREIRKNAIKVLGQFGDFNAIPDLVKVRKSEDMVLVVEAYKALENILSPNKIDIPAFIYHLVLSGYASPELLTDPNPASVNKAVQNIYPSGKGIELIAAALRIFNEKYSDQIPNPLWHSWINTTQSSKINEIKKMLIEMGNA